MGASMLASVVMELRPVENTRSGRVPALGGRALHGIFLSLIARQSSILADRLHNMIEEKPFTLVASSDSTAPLGGDIPSRSGQGCGWWLRATSFDDRLSQMLVGLVVSEIGALRLRNAELEAVGIQRSLQESPWAGQSTFEELYNNGVARARAEKGTNSIGLWFASPTAFRLVDSRLNMPLPWPHLVFQSLASKWNTFSSIPLQIDWPAFDRQISVARHRLETKMLDFGRYRQVGFVGECWYLIDRKAGFRLLQALHTLADFAFYAGVGAKTTMGMGLVQRIDKGG